jgi:hypothetical protein
MVAWLRDFFGGWRSAGFEDGVLLVLDPLGICWPAPFYRLTLAELTAEMLALETEALELPGPQPTFTLQDKPLLVVGREQASSEEELLARSSILLADPIGARSMPEVRAAFAGGLPVVVLRRCDYVVEVQSPTLLFTHKNRWGTAGSVIEFAPPEPACWNEPHPSR